MGFEGLRKEPIDQRKVDRAYENIQAQAAAYRHAFSAVEALKMAYERNIAHQGFLNLAENEALVSKLRQEIVTLGGE